MNHSMRYNIYKMLVVTILFFFLNYSECLSFDSQLIPNCFSTIALHILLPLLFSRSLMKNYNLISSSIIWMKWLCCWGVFSQLFYLCIFSIYNNISTWEWKWAQISWNCEFMLHFSFVSLRFSFHYHISEK